jgi:hypothetical protein
MLDSIDNMISNIFKIKHENEVKMSTIASFGLEAHLQINANKIEEGKQVGSFDFNIVNQDEDGEIPETDSERSFNDISGPGG